MSKMGDHTIFLGNDSRFTDSPQTTVPKRTLRNLFSRSQRKSEQGDAISEVQFEQSSAPQFSQPLSILKLLSYDLLLKIAQSLDNLSKLSLAYTCSRVYRFTNVYHYINSLTRCQK